MPWDYMYLPEYMQEEFQNATIEKDGVKRKLVTQVQQYLPNRLNFTNRKADDPVVVFGILLFLAILITIIEIKRKKIVIWLNYTVFIISVLAGLFLLFMWLGTDHVATAKNMNVLWLAPAQLLFLIAIKVKVKSQYPLILTALVYQFLISFILLIWPQQAELSFTLISLIFFVRILGYMVVNRQLSFKRLGRMIH